MNINRDYLIINDVKKSNIRLDNGSMFFYITDKNTQNIFVNLVINVSDNELIQKYANIENAEDYTLTMNILKPDNDYKIIEGKLHDKEKSIFEFNLPEGCVNKIGPYRCELLTKCTINGHEEITTSNTLTYTVKSSILNNLDDIVEAPEYPLVIQLFDKLSDIEQYEEDRRANELARQLAEEQRQTRFNALDLDMADRITAMDDKMVDVENRVSTKEQAVDKLIVDTKANIDEYKVAKDTEINNAITNQNNRLDAIESKNTQQDNRLLDIEKVNKRQDIDLKCLFADSKNNMIDIAGEGNSIYLQNSATGYTSIDEIKGNTLVNCNKEPNKELILNGNINTQGDNNITITEGVNGGLVDVTLEGNTLVNVSKTKDITALPLDEELTYLYANTQYTVQFISDKAITADITLGGTQLLAQNIVKGLNRISITTPATLTNNKLVINGVGANISKVVVTDTDREFGYFEGMKSVGQDDENNHKIEILSRNDNLFVPTQYIPNGWSDGNMIVNLTNCRSYWIECKPNTTYFVESDKSGNRFGVSCSDRIELNGVAFPATKGGMYGSSDDTDKVVNTLFTTDSTAKYLFVYVVNNGIYPTPKIMISESSSERPYIEPISNTQQLTHEPLRGVGDVKDRYVLIDGKWYIEKNCDEIVLDGSDDEKWIYEMNYDILVNLDFERPDVKKFRYYGINKRIDINGWEGVDRFGFINVKDYGITDLSTGRKYLSNNPINIIMPSSTSTYEPIDYNPFEVYNNTTHITTNSTIPTNITVKNHGFNCLLKPSTTYTVSSNLGINIITTPSVLTEDCLRFMDTDTSNITTMRDVLILEGDWTSKADLIPTNFSGIESCFEQEYDAEKGKYKVNVKVANEDKSKENNITFYINEPLRGVGNVKDKVFIKDDKVIVQRNCGSVTFDGSDDEGWGYHQAGNATSIFITLQPSDSYTSALGHILCDRLFGYSEAWNINNAREGCSFDSNGNIYIQISNSKLSSLDLNGFKQWLQQNPTTIVYPLVEPVYEEVEYNDTKLFIESFKNSTLFYNSNVPVTSKLHYSYSVPIVDTVAQTANVTDQQDSMIIDLATQVAVMEMMLM